MSDKNIKLLKQDSNVSAENSPTQSGQADNDRAREVPAKSERAKKGSAKKAQAQKGQVKKGQAQKGQAKARGKSRRFAMQAIYQWQMTGDSITGIKQQFFEENNFSKIDTEYFTELVSGVAASINDLDPLLEKYMSRLTASVDPVERAIIRLAAYEFLHRIDVPYRVVLNEAISITKEYCSENSHTFVNAVLDKVAKEIRHIEVKSREGQRKEAQVKKSQDKKDE